MSRYGDDPLGRGRALLLHVRADLQMTGDVMTTGQKFKKQQERYINRRINRVDACSADRLSGPKAI